MRLLLFVPLLSLISCFPTGHDFYQTEATVESTPVTSTGDAADDMAIWVHPKKPEKSLVFATDKKNGIEIYDLSGNKKALFPFGKMNNIDLRQSVAFGIDTLDIIACTNTTTNQIDLYHFNYDSLTLDPLAESPIQGTPDSVYGFSLYLSPLNQFLYAFSIGRKGILQQWLIKQTDSPKKVAGIPLRSFQFNGKSEGLVADDENGVLYVAEEGFGIWKIAAEPDQEITKGRVDLIRSNPNLAADLEGLALYKGPSPNEGYLIASSQGNNSFAVYQRRGANIYIGSFRIRDNIKLGIDKVTTTDGIEVCHLPLGPNFPYGIFIAQDDINESEIKPQNQNFKFVPWEKIAIAFKTPLYPANQ